MANAKVLLVDDDRTFTALITAVMKKMDCDVVIASNGTEAIQKVAEENPDLIILDVLMPQMTGYEFIQKLRDLQGIRSVPIIVISSRGSMKEFFADWEVHSFLVKPFTPDDLTAKVRDALKHKFHEVVSVETGPVISGSGKQVLVIGTEDYVNEKIKTFLQAHDFQVELVTDEKGALNEVAHKSVDLVLCKFHEDPSKLDAEMIHKKLLEAQKNRRFIFAVFCDHALNMDAMKTFPPMNIVSYDKIDQLINALGPFLTRSLPKLQKVA